MGRFFYILIISGLLVSWPLVAPGDPGNGRVRWVIDGDTVILADGRTIRYIGIDAPEMERDGMPAQAFAHEALALNRKMVQGRTVRLKFENQRSDRYHRTLAHLFLPDGAMPARAILQAGLAHCLPKPPNLDRTEDFLRIQREAMDRSLGRWNNWREPRWALLGNRRSLRVHRTDCPFGRRTGTRNQIRFPSLWHAFYAGYAPCKACMGGGWRSRTEGLTAGKGESK